MNIIIKEEKNIEEIVRLNQFVHDLHYQKHPDIFCEYRYDSMLKNLGTYIKQDHIKDFIAYDDNQPVGFILFVKRNYPETLFQEGHCSIYIDQICVRPEYRKKDIGKKLMDRLVQFCKEHGIMIGD
jgi:diamine N-acetyltransferase